MRAILKIISGIVSAFNMIMGNQRDNELRKDGARKADLAQRDKADEIRKESKKFRNARKPTTKSGAADRLRRNKNKG